ncbi:MAG: hypothetical protein Q3972_07460 [Corynebacterium sp.]|nr:hypothetical protein [Corynebacterium sp.]
MDFRYTRYINRANALAQQYRMETDETRLAAGIEESVGKVVRDKVQNLLLIRALAADLDRLGVDVNPFGDRHKVETDASLASVYLAGAKAELAIVLERWVSEAQLPFRTADKFLELCRILSGKEKTDPNFDIIVVFPAGGTCEFLRGIPHGGLPSAIGIIDPKVHARLSERFREFAKLVVLAYRQNLRVPGSMAEAPKCYQAVFTMGMAYGLFPDIMDITDALSMGGPEENYENYSESKLCTRIRDMAQELRNLFRQFFIISDADVRYFKESPLWECVEKLGN